MTTLRANVALIDTNILLAATNNRHPGFEGAKRLFGLAIGAGVHLALCGQIVREYMVVATRPVEVNGLGLTAKDALKNIAWFRGQSIFLDETEQVSKKLLELIQTKGVLGKRIHDAYLVALMHEYTIPFLVTANGGDFEGFTGFRMMDAEEFISALNR